MRRESEWLSPLRGSLLGDGRSDRFMSASASSRNGSDPFLFLLWWRAWCDGECSDGNVDLIAGGCTDASMANIIRANCSRAVCEMQDTPLRDPGWSYVCTMHER
jgi:hypothetical protein